MDEGWQAYNETDVQTKKLTTLLKDILEEIKELREELRSGLHEIEEEVIAINHAVRDN